MNKTGTVKSVNLKGTWETKTGNTMYKYEVVMEDETFGEYSSSKFQSTEEPGFPFQVGEQVEYLYEGGKFPKIKQAPKKFEKSNGFSKDADAINYHVALKEAREIVAFDGWGGHEELPEKLDYLSDIAYALAGRSKRNIEKLKQL